MAVVLDPVPSTFDVPLTTEPAQDAVLAVLRHARDRVRARHVTDEYIARNGAVCALGACFREEVSHSQFYDDLWTDAALCPVTRAEELLSAVVCGAIRALDVVAVELYPEAMGCENEGASWIGARIEDVNEFAPQSESKHRVLHCYDVAIERRKAAA